MSLPTMLRELDPHHLRDLAAAVEGQSPQRQARQRLDDEGREALFWMLLRGYTPTIGWWSRQFKRIGENRGTGTQS
jgi:hypothetical protein